MILAADVNPDTTGIDTKSTKKPKRRIPRNIVIHPDRKQSKATYSGIPLKEFLIENKFLHFTSLR